MDILMFTIYDRVTGVYSEPFLAVNVDTAERRFNYVLSQSPMVKGDCDLFKLGSFNTETGEIIPVKPEFISHYKEQIE